MGVHALSVSILLTANVVEPSAVVVDIVVFAVTCVVSATHVDICINNCSLFHSLSLYCPASQLFAFYKLTYLLVLCDHHSGLSTTVIKEYRSVLYSEHLDIMLFRKHQNF